MSPDVPADRSHHCQNLAVDVSRLNVSYIDLAIANRQNQRSDCFDDS